MLPAATGVVQARTREAKNMADYNQPSEPRTGGDGHAGIYAILVIIVVLIVGAVLYFSGVLGPRTTDEGDIQADINIETPNIEVPDTVTIVD
jgi:hypothetical protein